MREGGKNQKGDLHDTGTHLMTSPQQGSSIQTEERLTSTPFEGAFSKYLELHWHPQNLQRNHQTEISPRKSTKGLLWSPTHFPTNPTGLNEGQHRCPSYPKGFVGNQCVWGGQNGQVRIISSFQPKLSFSRTPASLHHVTHAPVDTKVLSFIQMIVFHLPTHSSSRKVVGLAI